MAGYPFRFYFRDYGLQGQEAESFTLRFTASAEPSPEQLDGLVDELETLLPTLKQLDLADLDAASRGVGYLRVFYADGPGTDELGEFDQAVDELLRAIHRHLPLAEVASVGGGGHRDAWETWSFSQREPTPCALEVGRNWVETPDGADGAERIRVKPTGVVARLSERWTAKAERARVEAIQFMRDGGRPSGFALFPCDEVPSDVVWHGAPTQAALDALAEHSDEPSFWFQRWGARLPDGGAAALLLHQPRKFSNRELTWVSPDGGVLRTGLSLNEVFAAPDGSVWSRFGPKFLRIPRDATKPDLEVAMRHAGPFAPLGGDDVLIVEGGTRLVRLRHDAGEWVRRGELEQDEVKTIVPLPAHPSALALMVSSDEHRAWVVYGDGDSLRKSDTVEWPVFRVGHLGARVYLGDPQGTTFELCNV